MTMKKRFLFLVVIMILVTSGYTQVSQFPQVYNNYMGSSSASNLNIRESAGITGNIIDVFAIYSEIGAASLSTNPNDPYFYNWIQVCIPTTTNIGTIKYGYIACDEFYARIDETNNYAPVTASPYLNIRPTPGSTTQWVTIGGLNACFGQNSIVALTGNTSNVGGTLWYEVHLTMNCSQLTGWLSGTYLSIPSPQSYYNIGGRVCDNAGNCAYLGNINGATINFSSLGTTFSSGGFYQYKLPVGWSGTITCTHPNYSTSTPAFWNYTASSHDYSKQFILSNSSAPSATTNPATNIGPIFATLNGSVSANNSNTTVTFEYGLTTSYGLTISGAPGIVTGNTNTSVIANISALTPNTLYHFRIKAVNSYGTTYGEDLTFTTTGSGSPPVAITNPATNIASNSATLNGLVNANNSSTSVTFEYGLTAAYGNSLIGSPSIVNGSINTAISANISGLIVNTTYHFRIKAVNFYGTTFGDDLTFITSSGFPCVPPTIQASSITFSNVQTNQMTINWTNGNGDKRIVKINTTNSFNDPVNGIDPPANSNYSGSVQQVIYNNNGNFVTVTGLNPGTTYWYRVYEANCTGADITFLTSTAINNPNSNSTSSNTNCATSGELIICADNISGSGPYIATGNGSIAPIGSCSSPTLRFSSGNFIIAPNSLIGSGTLYLDNILGSSVNLSTGSFAYNVIGSPATQLEPFGVGVGNWLFTMAGLKTNLTNSHMTVDCDKVTFPILSLEFPDILREANKSILKTNIYLEIAQASGYGLGGEIVLERKIKLKKTLDINELRLNFFCSQTQQSFEGAIKLKSCLFGIEGSAKFINALLDEIHIAYESQFGIPLGATGLRFIKFGGGVSNLTSYFDLTIDAFTQLKVEGIPRKQLRGEFGFKYEIGTSFTAHGSLYTFDEPSANAFFKIASNLIVVGADFNFKDILKGNTELSLVSHSRLYGILNLGFYFPDISTPKFVANLLNNLFTQGQAIGESKNFFLISENDKYISGFVRTNICLFLPTLYYNLGWDGNQLLSNWGTNYNILSSEALASIGDAIVNPYRRFTLLESTKSLVIEANNTGSIPLYEIYLPGGDTVTSFNYTNFSNIQHFEDQTSGYSAFNIFNPVNGEYHIHLTDIDTSTLKIYRADIPPMINITDVVTNGTSYIIHYFATDPEINSKITFGLDCDEIGANGLIIGDSIPVGYDSVFTWNSITNPVSHGKYYLYGIIQNIAHQFYVSYYPIPLTIVGQSSLNPPEFLSVASNDTSIIISLIRSEPFPSNNILYFSKDSNTVNLHSPSIAIGDTNDIGDTIVHYLSTFIPGNYYEFFATTIDTLFNESEPSEVVSHTWLSNSQNNAPHIIMEPYPVIAYVGNAYSTTIHGFDPDSNPLTYDILITRPSDSTRIFINPLDTISPADTLLVPDTLAHFTNNTGIILWTPTSNDLGYARIRVLLSDGVHSDSISYSIRIFDQQSCFAYVDFSKAYYVGYDEKPMISITDPDFQGSSDTYDSVQCWVYSNSDITGFTLTARETHPSSNTFSSRFELTESNSANPKLKVNQGDTIFSEFFDLSQNNQVHDYSYFTLFNADFQILKDTICSGENLYFKNTSTGDYIKYYKWMMGNNDSILRWNAQKTFFAEKGVGFKRFDITLIIKNNENNTDSITKSIYVARPVFLGNDTIVCDSITLIINNIDNPPVSYLWSTGSTSPTIFITVSGEYSVTIVDQMNCTSTDTINVTVNERVPVSVSISATENPVCAGTSVDFSAFTINGGNPSYQWFRNGQPVGTGQQTCSLIPLNGDQVWCVINSTEVCILNNQATSNIIDMSVLNPPNVTLSACFDTITFINARPVLLKGGIPYGGKYTGEGVDSIAGIFTPIAAGVGEKTIKYSYTNGASCSSFAMKSIFVQSSPSFNCGDNLLDIRDGKLYPTFQIDSQCWMAANLDYGNMILSSTYQRDNCNPEKFCYNNILYNCQLGSILYQWDELMQYDNLAGIKGLCPPGWHVPTEPEWDNLFANWTNNAYAGTQLKFSGSSGFNALLLGVNHLTKQWNFRDTATFFWSSTAHGPLKAWAHGINYYNAGVSYYPSLRTNAFSVRCIQDNCLTLPIAPSAGTHTAAPYQITWQWNPVAEAIGYKWSTINDFATAINMGLDTVKTETGLYCSTPYTRYVWAYSNCNNSLSTSLTDTTSQCTDCGSPITDVRDGKTYNTAQIGSQCWLKENMNIGVHVTLAQGQSNNGIIEKYCYNDSVTNCDIYGGLYKWDETMQYSTMEGIQGICPSGWHIPADAEWTMLSTFLGGTSIAGGKMKETGTLHWSSPNTDATNSSGFTAFPGGLIVAGTGFNQLTLEANFWSSTNYSTSSAYYRNLNYYYAYISGFWDNKIHAFSIRCIKDTCSSVPDNPIGGTHIPSPGQIIWNWSTVTGAVGYKWDTTNNYATATDMGNDTSATESGLMCNTSYTRYVWAYNNCGNSISTSLNQSTSACPSCGFPIIDSRDGKTYNTIQIGSQCWFKENLNIGTRIDGSQEQSNNSVIEKYCYADLELNCAIYGGLYQWNELMQYSTTPGIQGICPTGWHLPSDAEWTTLTTYLGGESIAGGKMKETGTTHWLFPNVATNASNFTGLPGGHRHDNSVFYQIGQHGRFWSSSQAISTDAWSRGLTHSDENIIRYYQNKIWGYSSRCIKDTSFVCGNPITDIRDGRSYNTVQIGSQCWLKENLNIGQRINGSQEQTNNSIIEKYCYSDFESNCDVYGGLYQWNEMMAYNSSSNTNPSNVEGICPSGWHLPSASEWTQLCNFLGGENVAGGKLKEVGTLHWFPPNVGATNESEFTGLPGGYFNPPSSGFTGLTYSGDFWSATESTPNISYDYGLDYNTTILTSGGNFKLEASSVRCLK